ncbi:MAG: ABC transporter ATP-binding protein [Promethearchaeota archaeon]|nr:MAG: ABC transporter ATP-binding protein [Candidatus Lokiarchaeota archaeon]
MIKTKKPNETKNVLILDNVYKYYDLGQTKVKAVDGISLKVKRGDFISIMGPSGSGKTTLLNLMGALDTPTKGNVYINDNNIQEENDSALTKLRRNHIGFIFQFYNLVPVLNCYENIELPLIISGVKKNKRIERVENILKKVGLTEVKEHKPNELSGGQQQRVAIARALVNNPSIVLADELTGDLDSTTGTKIMDFIQSLNRSKEQTAIIIVTHDKMIAKRTNHIYHIKDGKLIDI